MLVFRLMAILSIAPKRGKIYLCTLVYTVQVPRIKRVRWDSDPRHFNPVKYTDWLRAKRSTWLSYEPAKSIV